MMSDGALSQAEIDALLSGSSDSGGSTPAAVAAGMPEADRAALEAFFASTTNAQSSNLSMVTGSQVSLSGPKLTVNGREAFLAQLPETVTVVKVDFTSGFPGEHMFIIPEAGAKAIAGLMNKEENIQLDEMAMDMLGEAISQAIGPLKTALSGKAGNTQVETIPPGVTNIPKGAVALPAGDFAAAAYQLDLGGGSFFQIWEVLGPSVASGIAKALSSGGQAQKVQGTAPGMMSGGTGGMNMGGMQMGMGGMMGMDAGGGGMPFGQTNVQSVQFPTLMPHGGSQETGNIGLIMDVFMEMTVELGRTRKLIKEILAMGEGTIIELDKLAGEPVDILVNHKLIAKGEVVVIDENFGVRVTEIVSPAERMHGMG